MVHPIFVHHAQHDHPLQLPQQRRRAVRHQTEGLLALVIDAPGDGLHRLGDLFGSDRAAERGKAHFSAAQEQLFKGLQRVIEHLLALRRRAAETVGDRGTDEVMQHAHDLLAQVRPVEHLAALAIDDLALLIHHVVVFQHALAGLEVAALHRLLGLLDGIREHLVVKGHVLLDLQRLHHAHDPLGAEQAHDVVVEAEEEAALARVALAAGAAAQLVVDTSRLVPLGAQDEQAARGLDLFGLGGGDFFVLRHPLGKELARGENVLVIRLGIAGGLGNDGVVKAGLSQVGLGQVLRIAAEHDIRAAAGHVRRDRHGAKLARLGDDLGLFFVVLGVQDRVRHAAALQERGDVFALLDGHRADQHGLALFVTLDDLLDDRAVLAVFVFIDHVRVVDADDRLVRRDLDDVEMVDRVELLRFGGGGAGHAGELAVQTEIILEGDRGQGLVFLLHVDVLLGLDGLVQALAVAAAEHKAAGKLVDDDDLAVLDDIVDVPLHDAVGAQRLVDMVRESGVFDIRQVFQVEGALGLGDAAGRERGGAGLFVDDVVGVQILALLLLFVDGGIDHLFKPGDKIVRLAVEVGALVALTGDDQRGPGLVDEDRVHLVDDGENMSALDHVTLVEGHVVTQIVKAHLVVGAVCNVAGVGCAALLARQIVHDQANGQAHEAMDLSHPFAVAPRQVVVDGDDVHALARKGVEVGRQHGHQGFALAGLHLGDAALVEHDAADELNVEGLHAQHAPGRLPRGGKGFGQDVVGRLARGKARAELARFPLQFLVAQRGVGLVQLLDRVGDRVYFLQFPFGIASEDLIQ